MVRLFKSSLTLLLFASLVKNGISLTDEEDYLDFNVDDTGADGNGNTISSLETGEGKGDLKSENGVEVMDRDARASGNSHFLRPLRTPNLHFLRSLKKREIGSGGKMHFLRSLRQDPDSDWVQMIGDENVLEGDEINDEKDNSLVHRSTRSNPTKNMHFLRPLRTFNHMRSLRGSQAHFLRSLRAPESHFLRSLRAPPSHFLRSLRAPEAHFLRSLRAPPSHFLRSLRAPPSHFLRSLRAPPSHFLRSLRAPPSHFLRSLRAPDSHFLRSLRAPEAHFLRSLRLESDGKGKRMGHFLRSLRSPSGANFLRSLRQDSYMGEINDAKDQVSNQLGELLPTEEDASIIDYENGQNE